MVVRCGPVCCLPDDAGEVAAGDVEAGNAATSELVVRGLAADELMAGEAVAGDCGCARALIVSAESARGSGGMKRKRAKRAVPCAEPARLRGAPSTTTFELLIVRQPAPSGPRYRMSMRTTEKV